MNPVVGPPIARYTTGVELILLAIVITAVAIDALGRLDERGRKPDRTRDDAIVTTQKIIVDLTKRR